MEPQINYDDFYKFIVSAGIALVVVFMSIGAYFLLNAGPNGPILFAIYSAIGSIGGVGIGVGLNKWYANQKLIDKKCKLETDIKEMELKKLQLEYKNLESEWDADQQITISGLPITKETRTTRESD